MKVGFLNNQIDNRGTGNALFDYAHYNEEILGNESVILTNDTQQRDELMAERLIERFKYIYPYDKYMLGMFPELDVVYHIKSGADQTTRWLKKPRYVSHGVFECPTDGDRNAVVSDWLSGRCGVPSVPHIVSLPNTTETLRDRLGLTENAIILGRHGGNDSFDISFVWDAIGSTLDQRRDIIFLFVNTDGIPHEILNSGRVISAPAVSDPWDKRVFINTCDAMLHARSRGETFGIAVGEFAKYGKPIITYGDSPEQAHYTELPYAEKYYNKEDLVDILVNFQPYHMKGYQEYSPEKVMKKFKEVFLD